MKGLDFFAVVDPANPQAVTYWRRSAHRPGQFDPWPRGTRYGPRLLVSDIPAGLGPLEAQQWAGEWYRTVGVPWHAAVEQEIRDDPGGCAARFARLTTRCCWCGRRLTDPGSKVYGVGPDCRADMSPQLLHAYAGYVSREHARAQAAEAEAERARVEALLANSIDPAKTAAWVAAAEACLALTAAQHTAYKALGKAARAFDVPVDELLEVLAGRRLQDGFGADYAELLAFGNTPDVAADLNRRPGVS